MPLSSVSAITRLNALIAETIAWCRPRASVADPANCLRTPALRPSNLKQIADQWEDIDYEWGSVEENQAVVSGLAERRAELLRLENVSTDALPLVLTEGRLLAVQPEDSDQCVLSGPNSKGFIDDLDLPAWDTWIYYAREPILPDPEAVRRRQEEYRAEYKAYCTKHNREQSKDFKDWQPDAFFSYILCWIPEPFIPLVEIGICVNPTWCLFWAAEHRQLCRTTKLLLHLEAAGMLR